jgi:hypothetical protein
VHRLYAGALSRSRRDHQRRREHRTSTRVQGQVERLVDVCAAGDEPPDCFVIAGSCSAVKRWLASLWRQVLWILCEFAW